MRYIFTLLFALVTGIASAQTCADFAVQLTATVQTTPARITLNWKRLSDSNSYKVYRKTKTALAWSSSIATRLNTDSTFTDTTVIVDSAYEYFVSADHYVSGVYKWTAAGYIYAGIKAPAIHSKGALVLIVDSTYSDSCAAGIRTLMKDISGDGWQVIRHDVPRSMRDTGVKGLIKRDFSSISNVRSVLLLGHVAVPYSGDLNPDGHPDHLGAWPADVYYGDMTGTWTDASVVDTSAGYAANRNRAGDGKWDQTVIPAAITLQVGRVDFYDMPAFTAGEFQMMRSYLAKDHKFKMDSLYVRNRGLISDNFGVFSSSAGYESFASTAWRSFPPLLSRDSFTTTSALIANLDTASYKWAYGCGGGSFGSAGGIGATADFASHNVNGIFTILFGSYFGDWNVTNNFLRAPMCSNNPALTSCWSGRPYWFFHHMALGENIGFSAWHSQNSDGNLYGPPSPYGIQAWIHIALLGDPTLRTEYVKPATNLVITHAVKQGANLSWTASAGTGVIGYYVYRSTSEFGSYQRISNMVTGTTFHDTVGADGLKYYMVRPVRLQSSPSGVYNNLGLGITDSATVSFNHVAVEQLAATNLEVNLFPNPASSYINLSINAGSDAVAAIRLVSMSGETFAPATKQLTTGANVFTLQVGDLPAGIYSVIVSTGGVSVVKEWVKL